jgi:hypothetical protein
MRVIDSSGRYLDAQYLVEPDGDRLALILESRAGRPARNSECSPALTLLLTRLAAPDAVLADALVDSDRIGQHLPGCWAAIADSVMSPALHMGPTARAKARG